PVYFILCKIIPWIFLIPHPFYFHFAHHFAAIISIILGIDFFVEYIQNNKELLNKFNAILTFYYIGFIAVFIIIYLFAPVPTYDSQAYKFLFKYKEWKWFLSNPILYFIIASSLLIFIYSFKKKNFNIFKYTLITAVFLEAFYIGYQTFYKNMVMPRPLEKNKHENMQRPHFTLPGKNPFYSQINELKTLAEKSEYRWASDLAIIDSMSWMINGRTLAGYDSKPIITNIRKILESFYVNFPYQIVAFGFPKHLLSNMNVGHIIAYNNLLEENKLYNYNIEGIDYYFIRKKEYLENLNEELYDFYFRHFDGPGLKIHDIEKPLPYIYFQNIIYKADMNIQKELLFKEDLSNFAMIKPDDDISISTKTQKILNIEDLKNLNVHSREQFEEIQNKNKIININKKFYNKLKLTAEVNEPVLMVRNEAFHPDWKILINGKKEKLFQVNYVQQGVLLKPGRHEIIFEFFPERLKTGIFISLLALIINILIAAFFLIKTALKNKK
ncbi:MAG: YfhO family protein, partial [Spirochaetes bacterium]|nr:YfhO family protein [Spirochaetota bacterium]